MSFPLLFFTFADYSSSKLTAMGTIKSLGKIDKTLTKSGIVDLAQSDADEVIYSNDYDMLQVYIELKRYEQYLEAVIEKIKPMALQQATGKQEKSFDYMNAKISIQNRLTYDFSHDRKWQGLRQSEQVFKTQLKDHETFLKQLTQPVEVVDETTGEVLVFEPPTVEQNQLMVVRF